MALPPCRVLPMDQATLLRVVVLTLSNELRTQVPYVGRIMVRHHFRRDYLVITPLQWTVLKAFEGGRTVPGALKHLIHERGAIPLRDFYELVLKAYQAGILHSPDQPPPEPPPLPVAWKRSLSGKAPRQVAMGTLGLAIALLLFNSVTAPALPLWWLAGWLLTCAATSAGFALAACALHAADLDLYNARFVWKSVMPHFEIDLGESLLGGPAVQIDCAIMRIAPQAALTAIASVWVPNLVLPLLCGLLWNLAPWWRTPALKLLRALHHTPRLSVSRDFLFPPNRSLLRRLQSRLDRGDLRFALLRGGYTLVWVLLVALTWSATTSFDTTVLVQWSESRNLPGLWALGLLAALLLVVLAGLVLGAIILGQECAARLADRRSHRQEEAEPQTGALPTPEQIMEFLGENYPFTILTAEQRFLVAQAMTPVPYGAAATIITAGDRHPTLYLLYSGRLAVSKPGILHTDTHLSPGSIFGESVLLQNAAQPFAIRSLSSSIVLTLGATYYDHLIAPVISRASLENAAQKIAFLRDIPLCRHWPPHQLASLARRTHIHTFRVDSMLLGADRDNTDFFILQEGELRVFKDGRKVGRLRRGDFFGEISLLQNSVTSADVIGHKPGRYLSMPKQDFLFFMTQNSTVALQFERIASRRLGRPVFPL